MDQKIGIISRRTIVLVVTLVTVVFPSPVLRQRPWITPCGESNLPSDIQFFSPLQFQTILNTEKKRAMIREIVIALQGVSVLTKNLKDVYRTIIDTPLIELDAYDQNLGTSLQHFPNTSVLLGEIKSTNLKVDFHRLSTIIMFFMKWKEEFPFLSITYGRIIQKLLQIQCQMKNVLKQYNVNIPESEHVTWETFPVDYIIPASISDLQARHYISLRDSVLIFEDIQNRTNAVTIET